jgi:hypothetical protein
MKEEELYERRKEGWIRRKKGRKNYIKDTRKDYMKERTKKGREEGWYWRWY